MLCVAGEDVSLMPDEVGVDDMPDMEDAMVASAAGYRQKEQD